MTRAPVGAERNINNAMVKVLKSMRLNVQERSELKIQSRIDPAIGGISGLYSPPATRSLI